MIDIGISKLVFVTQNHSMLSGISTLDFPISANRPSYLLLDNTKTNMKFNYASMLEFYFGYF